MLPAAANLTLAPHAPTDDPLANAERYERLKARIAPPAAVDAADEAGTSAAIEDPSTGPPKLFGRLKAARRAMRLAKQDAPVASWRVLGPEPSTPLPPMPPALTPRAQALARSLDAALR